MDILFSICITSYNRVYELSRLLYSIDSKKYGNQLEIIISEDNSPNREKINQVVYEFSNSSKYEVVYNANNENLGYDRNLGKLKELARGTYIIYMSDDDSFVPNSLDKYLDSLLKYESAITFQPFVNSNGYNRKYNNDFFISSIEKNVAKHICDSILFSGLTFKRDLIHDYNAEMFLNTYYFQVYMFMSTLYKYGAQYIDIYLVSCNGDGENGFGLSESSIKNEYLINRKSVFSKLEFHKGLLKVINIFDKENNLNTKSIFAYEYSLRTLSSMCKARLLGKEVYRDFIKMQESLDIKLTSVYYIYKYIIYFLGGKLALLIFSLLRTILLNFRKSIKR